MVGRKGEKETLYIWIGYFFGLLFMVCMYILVHSWIDRCVYIHTYCTLRLLRKATDTLSKFMNLVFIVATHYSALGCNDEKCGAIVTLSLVT